MKRSPWHDSTAEPICAVDLSPEEEIYEALVLGVRDYFSKCGFKSAVLGLSGGIDSAVTAVLAVAALGKENVVGVSMPSQYSSQGSLDDAADSGEKPGDCAPRRIDQGPFRRPEEPIQEKSLSVEAKTQPKRTCSLDYAV